MAKNTKKRAIIYSNVKENKKRAEVISRIKENQINLNDEIIIGLSKSPKNKPIKENNNKPIKKNKKNKKVSNSSKNNNTKKKKVMNPRKRKIILRAIKLTLAIIILLIGLIAFFKSSLFNIKNINVSIENNKILTESQIKNLSTINIGQNIYSINKRQIVESIKSNPYVESVKIKRSLPGTLKIEIEERTVRFQLDYNGEYIYIDNQGYILEKSYEKNDTILVSGYSTTELSYGNRLDVKDLEKLSDVIQIMQESKNNELDSQITKIDIEDDDDYKIYFDGLGKIAHLGDTTSINDKLTYIKKILEVESDYEGEIFVNVNLNNGEYPYFREKV